MSEAMAAPMLSATTVAMRTQGQAPALSANARLLYRTLLRGGPVSPSMVPEVLREFDSAAMGQLSRLGLVRETPHGLMAVPRAQVIDELLTEQASLLQRALDEVMSRQRRIRMLLEAGPDLEGDGERIQTVPLHHDDQSSLYPMPTRARRELMAIHPDGHFAPEVLEQSLSRAEDSINAGVRLRVVHQAGALVHKGVVSYLQALEDLGAWVRLRDNLPFRLLMIDQEAAVCSAPGDSSGEDVFVVRGQRVITLLARVFETAWVDSTPLRTVLAGRQLALQGEGVIRGRADASAAPVPLGRQGAPAEQAAGGALDDVALAQRYARLSPQQQLILRCLAEGETDRMIARRTGVTPRTITRRIAEIYQELSVESRFQAGVVAHRLGLV